MRGKREKGACKTGDRSLVQVGIIGVMGIMDIKNIMNPEEAAEYLGVNQRELRNMKAKRLIPFIKYSARKTRYLKRDLDKHIEMHRVESVISSNRRTPGRQVLTTGNDN